MNRICLIFTVLIMVQGKYYKRSQLINKLWSLTYTFESSIDSKTNNSQIQFILPRHGCPESSTFINRHPPLIGAKSQ